MPPPKVIKSILKKNKKRDSENAQSSIAPQVSTNSSDRKLRNNEEKDKVSEKHKLQERYSSSKQIISNGHAKKVHLKDDETICTNDTVLVNEERVLKHNLKNEMAVKASDHVHTVEVDIH